MYEADMTVNPYGYYWLHDPSNAVSNLKKRMYANPPRKPPELLRKYTIQATKQE
jgi:hypothetical protein